MTSDPDKDAAWYWAAEQESSPEAPWQIRDRHRRKAAEHYDGLPTDKLPYEIVMGGAPIRLTTAEYRIITFLAAKPYHAFTPEQILAHVNEQQPLVQTSDLQQQIYSLRSKLGFFRDYIQSVPYIGYRFKP